MCKIEVNIHHPSRRHCCSEVFPYALGTILFDLTNQIANLIGVTPEPPFPRRTRGSQALGTRLGYLLITVRTITSYLYLLADVFIKDMNVSVASIKECGAVHKFISALI